MSTVPRPLRLAMVLPKPTAGPRRQGDGQKACIVSGQRTPFAKSFGQLKHHTAIDLGVAAVRGLLRETELDPQEIDEVIYGNVVVHSGAPNIAREILLDAKLPASIPGTTVVLQCLSGQCNPPNGAVARDHRAETSRGVRRTTRRGTHPRPSSPAPPTEQASRPSRRPPG